MVICPARSPHWIGLISTRAKGLWFHLDDIERWRFLYGISPVIRISREIKNLDMLMDQYLIEAAFRDSRASQIAFHYAEIIALILTRELGSKYDARETLFADRLEKLWSEVNADLKADWTVERLASRAKVSSGYLHKLVLKYFNVRPMQMVLRLRMNHAMELLINTNLSLDSIAEEVGYGTAYAFSKAFLRYSGKRPGAFRHEISSVSPAE